MTSSSWMFWSTGLLMLAGSLAVSTAQGQDVQVPLAPDSTVYTMDRTLQQELGLFADVQGFQQARLFRLSGNRYELVIEYRTPDGQLFRSRRALSPAEVDEFRQRVAERLVATQALVDRGQPGRPELLVWTTALSAAQGGLLIGALDPSNESLVAGLPLMAGAAGFFGPFFATQDRPVTEAAGTLTGFGGLQGYAHGTQLATLVGGDDIDGQVTAGVMAAMGATEAIVGYRLGATRGWSPGMAEMMAFNGVAGNLVGFGLGVIAAGDEAAARSIAGGSLLGSVLGGAVGYRMGRTDTYTRGDARLYVQTGLLAAQLAVSATLVGDIETARGVGGVLTASGVAGLGAGGLLVRDRDFSTYASNLITLGNYAGSLLGAGVATVASGNADAVTVMQALGAVAGFGITYSVFAPDARREAQSAHTGSLRLQVMPSLSVAPHQPAAAATRLRPGLTLKAHF